MTLETLQHLAANGPSWAAQRAQLALQIEQEFQSGNISEDEHRELLVDIARSDTLDHDATDLDTKTALVMAIFAIAQVV